MTSFTTRSAAVGAMAVVLFGIAALTGADAMPLGAASTSIQAQAAGFSVQEVRYMRRHSAARKEHRINHRERCNNMPSRC